MAILGSTRRTRCLALKIMTSLETDDYDDCDSDVQELSEADVGEEHPWPYLKSMFEFAHIKNADTDKKAFVFKCLLCAPKTNHITAFCNSTSNLKKHVDVSKHFTTLYLVL